MPRYMASLNGIPLDQTGFEWPIYRGAQPRFQQFLVTVERWRSLFSPTMSYGANTLTVSQEPLPNERGVRSVTRTFERVHFLRAARINAYFVAVVLADARYALQGVNSARCVNVRSFDGSDSYLVRTASGAGSPLTLDDVLEEMRIELENAGLNVAFDAGPPGSRDVPDNIVSDGVSIGQSLDAILTDMGLQMTVTADGTITIIEPTDNLDRIRNLSTQVKWLEDAPPVVFEAGAMRYANEPRRVRAHYYEQRSVRATYDPTATISQSPSGRPDPRLEQVYFYRGQWRNEQECRAAVTLLNLDPNTWPSESEIRRYFFADKWTDTRLGVLQRDGESLEAANSQRIAEEIVSVIRTNWRSAFRVTWPDGFGAADTPGLQPGVFDDEGNLTNQSVECAWVDLLNSPTLVSGVYQVGKSRWDSSNDFGPAPFAVEYDATAKVIVFKPVGNTSEVRARIPGNLASGLLLQTYAQSELSLQNRDASSQLAKPDSIFCPSTANATFTENLLLRVGFVYTRRIITDRDQYYTIDDQTDTEQGLREVVDLPVPDSPKARYGLDDPDVPINLDELTADAERRSRTYLAPFKAPALATAESPTLELLEEVTELPDGVSAVSVVTGSKGPNYMGVKLELQDLERIAELKAAREPRPAIEVNGVRA